MRVLLIELQIALRAEKAVSSLWWHGVDVISGHCSGGETLERPAKSSFRERVIRAALAEKYFRVVMICLKFFG